YLVSGTRVAIGLDGAGRFNPSPNIAGAFPRQTISKLLVIDPGHFQVDIDTIQQRSTDSLLVPIDLVLRTAALAHRIAIESTWTRIHRGHQRNIGRERDRP